jgi:hypothetical protein
MQKSDIRVLQLALKERGYYRYKVDGISGDKTRKAVRKAVQEFANKLPKASKDWSDRRLAVAVLQLLCKESKINPGKIDGLIGPDSEYAFDRFRTLKRTGSLPRAFSDIVPTVANPGKFPLERREKLIAHYGAPGRVPLVKVKCPWKLTIDWEPYISTSTIRIHKKLAASLESILESAWDHYGEDGIRKHGLHRYGGSYNNRFMRGSMSRKSTHAWGIAIDWFPSRNKLRWSAQQASLAHPDLDFWWELWEKEGWVSLGRSENRDWMHVQAAKRP